MNKHGQVLVIFIIIMPVLLLMFGIVVEQSYLLYKKVHIENVTKDIINNCIDRCQKNDIIDLYDKNNIIVNSIDVDNSNGCEIKLETTVKTYLKSLIDTSDYHLKFDIVGTKNNNKIKYEKGS